MKEVIILSGGLGTRLKPVVNNLPKCLAIVNNRPFIAYILDSLIKYQYDKYIFALGYMNEEVIHYVKTEYPNLNVVFSVEEEQLLTGGAIRLALEYVESESVLILNADTFLNINLNTLKKFHNSFGADITIVLKPLYDFERYGSVKFDIDHWITHFEEKKYMDFGYINCGYIYLNKNVLLQYPIGKKFSFEKDFISEKINRLKIKALIDKSYFIDIGIPEDFIKAQMDFRNMFLENEL